jgi:hypothetical protein
LQGLQAQLQQGDRLIRRFVGKRVGQLIRVKLTKKTKDLLDRVSADSSRTYAAIVTAAAKNYLEDPGFYRPHIRPSEKPQETVEVSVRVSRGISDFFLDEAFAAPIRARRQLLGLIVGAFLRRFPYKPLVTALHTYADIIGPMIREKTNGKSRSQDPEDHQAR